MAAPDLDFAALVQPCSLAQPDVVEVPKRVVEYPLPAARQTHEMAAVGDDLLLLSQQTNSHLVKVTLDPSTGSPLEARRFRVGKTNYSGLHGLYASRNGKYPKQIWATLQFESAVVRINPVPLKPQVLQWIDLPSSVWGPHVVLEDGDDLWITCKDSHHVVWVKLNPKDSSVVSITSFKCSSRPICVAVHPRSGDVYATLSDVSKIFRLVRNKSNSSYSPCEIDIPPANGSTPVGIVAGPDKNVWFVLLGDESGGTGTFGRISEGGDITWYRLSNAAGAGAGLIHLAVGARAKGPYPHRGSTLLVESSKVGGGGSSLVRLWLLGSSMASSKCVDAIFTVDMDEGEPPRVVCQNTITLPTHRGMAHRILATGDKRGLYVSEMGASLVAHVTGSATMGKVPCETCDSSSDWGLGCSNDNVKYEED